MTSLWPGGPCEFCEPDEDGHERHEKCVGWARAGFDFCGCAKGLCGLRLELQRTTGVMWQIQEPPTEGNE